MDNHLKTLSKTENDLVVGNYIVLFGGKDLAGEFFTKSTRLESGYTDSGLLYVDFEHGLDPDNMGIDDSHVLGVVDWKSAKADDKGVFVERVLNRRAKYVDLLVEMIEAGLVGNSSEAVRGKTMRKRDGEITLWPLKRDTLTLTPMEPRMLTENVMSAAKSLFEVFPRSRSLAVATGAEIPDEIKTIQSIQTVRDAETYLRDAGRFSRSQAEALIARFKTLSAQGEPGSDGQSKAIQQAIAVLTSK
ncbi:hypothetical protein [uncultured Ramlibacter sp.]|mgnify:CR=1 FL=1|uniref:hypothetical protein n=1 Tax=uncultured Ramlibacter sp. TaxID=260755 RepID=UPI0026176D99|nr:hypothetical protein [uncultured Ramlibacter sp.]